jgi:gliding motility-associated-like protein
MWTQISGPTATIINPNSATSTISSLVSGNVYIFKWSLSNGACENYDFDEVMIFVDDSNEAAEAGLNFDVCNETTTLLNATPSAFGATGIWTQTPLQSGMGVVIVDPSDPNSMVTGLEANNEYIFTWTLSNAGCGEISSDEVIVFVEENDETAFAGDDFVSCGDGETQLNAAVPESGTGTWSVNDPDIIFVDINDPQTIAQGLQTGFYTFTWTLDNGACGVTFDETEVEYELAPAAIDDEFTVDYASSANFNVLTNDLFDGPVNVVVLLNPSNGTVENLGNGVLEYTANSSFRGTDEFTYQVCSQACEDVCSEATVSLRIGDDVECVAPTIFTPNNDGVNDAFIVPCFATGNYPQNEVSIFNQWGDVVFHASPYFNDWEGTYDGQDLPVGTYYYVVKFNNDQFPVSGFLVLER